MSGGKVEVGGVMDDPHHEQFRILQRQRTRVKSETTSASIFSEICNYEYARTNSRTAGR
jgi:hypothetical protein